MKPSNDAIVRYALKGGEPIEVIVLGGFAQPGDYHPVGRSQLRVHPADYE
jgi:hypothetical protein